MNTTRKSSSPLPDAVGDWGAETHAGDDDASLRLRFKSVTEA